MVAANLASVFGNSAAARAANSPYSEAAADAAALRSTHTLIWMYTGKSDPSAHRQTTEFARQLRALDIPYVSLISSGTHDWSLWRTMMAQSLITAADNVTTS
jgi:S-formylglutathione hydrolase FrmB